MRRQIYFDAVLTQLPRLLGQINTNPGLPTYGCGDRHYWHNKVVGFPNARYQEAVLTLALLYDKCSTPYRGQPLLLELINAMVDFWIGMQETDGSFNEWYVHEGSYVATAFSSYAISETLLLLGKERIRNYAASVAGLRRSATWLKTRHQKSVCNQQTGALLAIHNTFELTQDEELRQAAFHYEDLIASCQDPEGWFKEYAGVDIGYLSLAIDYLSKYVQKTKSEKITLVVNKAMAFLAEFILSDGTAGGVYTSRDTEYLIAHGFELWADRDKNAAWVAWNIRDGLVNQRGVSLHSLDDRYLMYVGYTYLQAGLDGVEELIRPQRVFAAFHYYPNAGVVIYRQDKLELIASLKKVGAFVALKSGHRISDSGVLVAARKLCTAFYQSTTILNVDAKGFTVEGDFLKFKTNLMTPFNVILLNVFQLTLGRFAFINKLIKDFLREKLILAQKSSGARLRRAVTVTAGRVVIQDRISGLSPEDRVTMGAKLSFVYVPSCRWFERENLSDAPVQNFLLKEGKPDAEAWVITREFT